MKLKNRKFRIVLASIVLPLSLIFFHQIVKYQIPSWEGERIAGICKSLYKTNKNQSKKILESTPLIEFEWREGYTDSELGYQNPEFIVWGPLYEKDIICHATYYENIAKEHGYINNVFFRIMMCDHEPVNPRC
jgi:hypothetical protein